MKPFNLEKALAGDPVTTRSGLKVLEIYLWKSVKFERKLSYYAEGDPSGFPCWVDDNGRLNDNGTETPFDLLMEPKTKTYWVNIYKGDTTYTSLTTGKYTYDSEQVCRLNIGDHSTHIACLSFEVKE